MRAATYLILLMALIPATSLSPARQGDPKEPDKAQNAPCPCSPVPTLPSKDERLPGSKALSEGVPFPALCPDVLSLTKLKVAAGPSIRGVDFASFSFPSVWTGVGVFTLKHGELSPSRGPDGAIEDVGLNLGGVTYGDVTGDRREDAIVTIALTTGGSAVPHRVYVFTPSSNGPTLVWAFETGDRADWGLHNVYAERGDIVLELNDPENSNGACCPVRFVRNRFRWNGSRFCPIAEWAAIPIGAEP